MDVKIKKDSFLYVGSQSETNVHTSACELMKIFPD
jgi:hypothetical protein